MLSVSESAWVWLWPVREASSLFLLGSKACDTSGWLRWDSHFQFVVLRSDSCSIKFCWCDGKLRKVIHWGGCFWGHQNVNFDGSKNEKKFSSLKKIWSSELDFEHVYMHPLVHCCCVTISKAPQLASQWGHFTGLTRRKACCIFFISLGGTWGHGNTGLQTVI